MDAVNFSDISEARTALVPSQSENTVGLNNDTTVDIDSIINEFEHHEGSINNNILLKDNHKRKVVLININTPKTWIAYLTREQELSNDSRHSKEALKQWYITISSFDSKSTSDNLSGAVTYSFDMTHLDENLNEKMIMDANYSCKFLSVSKDGKRVALSFMAFDKRHNIVKEPIYNRNILVFCVADNGYSKELGFEKKLPFQGRAVYLDNNQLALINEQYLQLYNTRYELVQQFNVKSFASFQSFEKIHHSNPPPWGCYSDNLQKSTASLASNILAISSHIQDNVLITPYKNFVHVWSILDGIRLASVIKDKNEDIMALSADKANMVTFVEMDKQKLVKIYHMQTGLLTHELYSQTWNGDDAQFKPFDVQFTRDANYLIMVGTLTGSQNDRVVIEVWHIESRESVYYRQEEIGLYTGDDNSVVLSPFAIVNEGMLKVIYVTCMDETTTKEISIDINIRESRLRGLAKNSSNSGPLDIERLITLDSTSLSSYLDVNTTNGEWTLLRRRSNYMNDPSEKTNRLNDIRGITCYIRKYGSSIYLIRFTSNLVQLWRIKHLKKNFIDDSDTLLFIHSYDQHDDKNLSPTIRNMCMENPSREENIDFVAKKNIILANNFTLGDGMVDRILVRLCSSQETPAYFHEVVIPFQQLISSQDARRIDLQDTQYVLKSACYALYYLHGNKKFYTNEQEDLIFNSFTSSSVTRIKTYDMVYDTDFETIYTRTKLIIQSCINEIKNNIFYNDFFTTMDGSDVLLILSSFNDGKQFLFQILEADNLPIALFSYSKPLKSPKILEGKHNALIVLIQRREYDLYKLLFNQIVFSSKELGVGCLMAISDTLIYLQKKGNNDLLQNSTRNLSHLVININKLLITDDEMFKILKHYVETSPFFETYATKEEIHFENPKVLINMKHSLGKILSAFQGKAKNAQKFILNTLASNSKDKTGNHKVKRTALCVVPLPYFCSYHDFTDSSNKTMMVSSFLEIVTNLDDNSLFGQGDIFLEALLDYKWNHFVRYRFYFVYLLQLIYYICFSIGVSFSKEVFKYQNFDASITSHAGHMFCICVFFLIGAVLLIQEVRQIWKLRNWINYFKSVYNWIDMAALALPIASFVLLERNHDAFDSVNSFAILTLWIHGILRLRIVATVGIALETIIQLILAISEILLIMFLVICAFTNAYMALLMHRDDEYFQEEYAYDDSTDNQVESSTLRDVSSSNTFDDVYKSFANLWFFIYGVWDPVNDGDAGDNKVIIALSILFSLITVLIFFNFVIAYMNNSIEKVRRRGKRVWINHYASVVGEIEQLWCPDKTNIQRKNNPAFIYYWSQVDDISKQEDKLQEETLYLIRKLRRVYAENDPTSDLFGKTIDEMRQLLEDQSKMLEKLSQRHTTSRNNSFRQTTY